MQTSHAAVSYLDSISINTLVITFVQFIVEYPLSYFEAMPDAIPPAAVAAAAKRFGLAGHIEWKWLTNKQFTHSYELETGNPADGIIAMRHDDIRENWFHELGHEILDHADKNYVRDTITPLLDKIKTSCQPSKKWLHKQTGKHYKWIQLGEYKYTYSHSGMNFEHDEIFAISFAFIIMGHHFNDSILNNEYQDMLDKLEDANGRRKI